MEQLNGHTPEPDGASVQDDQVNDQVFSTPQGHGNESTERIQSKPVEKTDIPEIKRIFQFRDGRGNSQILAAENYKRRKRRVPGKDLEGPFKDYAMVVRKILGIYFDLQGYRLELQSEGLRNVFKEIGRPYYELDLDANPIIIRHPFPSLFFLREQIKDLSDDAKVAAATRTELKELLAFIYSEPALQHLVSRYEETVPRGKIARRLQWTLFRPHDWIYLRTVRGDKHVVEWCGVVYDVDLVVDPSSGIRYYNVQYLTGHHNGSEFGLRSVKMRYGGDSEELLEINKESLMAIPMRFLSPAEQDEIRSRLIKRGKFYVDLCSSPFRMLHYNGPIEVEARSNAQHLGDFDTNDHGFNTNWEANERVIVDKQAQHELSSISEIGDKNMISPSIHEFLARRTPKDDSENEESDDDSDVSIHRIILEDGVAAPDVLEEARRTITKRRALKLNWKGSGMTDEDYLLCPESVVAFLMREKIWAGEVLLDGLREIEWKSDPYLFLQLPQDKKTLIVSLVRGFGMELTAPTRPSSSGNQGSPDTSPDVGFDDIIEGKGKGLIFLLHGPPGLGKTLTAESVAETTHRALYHVSAGELSTDVEKLEKQLSEIFRLGKRWGAVVLLDEAGVLMARRNSKELQRNAIVAVFLRMLEYYDGMLFLTTNRLDKFDDAFANRIHITVKYDSLQPTERSNIWQQHLSRACRRNKQARPRDPAVYATLGRIETNGRDIRNYTRTAYGFAAALREDLNIGHVVTVIRNNLSREKGLVVEHIFAELERMDKAAVEERGAEIEAGVDELKEDAEEADK